MSILWLCIGIVIGIFIPGPFNNVVRGWLSNLWSKITGGSSEVKNTKSKGGCC